MWAVVVGKLQSILLACSTLASLAACSSTAYAVPMQAVWTGTVSDVSPFGYGDPGSSDQTNTFGNGAGFNTLAGLSYTMTFIYDPSEPGFYRNMDPATADQAKGGQYFHYANDPISSASLTINGHTETLTANFRAFLEVSSGHFVKQIAEDSYFTTSGFGFSAISNLGSFPISSFPNDLEAPITSRDFLLGYGFFQFEEYDWGRGEYVKRAIGFLKPTTLTISQVSEVPLPAALPLFVVGLGALGAAARTKRKRTLGSRTIC